MVCGTKKLRLSVTSLVFLVVIVAVVTHLALTGRDQLPPLGPDAVRRTAR